MYFNRIEAKFTAKQCMRMARPSPLLVSLVYILLTAGVSNLIALLLGDPTVEMRELLLMGYQPQEVLGYLIGGRAASLTVFGVVSVLLSVYTTIMEFGHTSYALRLSRREQAGYGNLFDGFSRPLRVFGAQFLVGLFATLWGLLGMIPGIALMVAAGFGGMLSGMLLAWWLMVVGFLVVFVITALRYRLTAYFILDDPDCTALEAVRRSKRAMKGWKMELFTLDLSFLGWDLLAALTAGLLMMWVGPYQGATEALFYEAVTKGSRGGDLPPMDPEGFKDIHEDDNGPSPF